MNKEQLKTQLVSEMLLLPPSAIDYHTSEHLRRIYPEKALVEGEMGMFNVEGYAKAGLCTLIPKPFLYNQMSIYWQGPEPAMMMHRHHMMMRMQYGVGPFDAPQGSNEGKTEDSINKAWFDVTWQEHTLEILIMSIEGNGMYKNHFWLLADTEVVARNFYAEVCRWNEEIRAEVLVFDNGHWHKDEHLFQDIKNSTFENLILRGELKQEIREDVEQFFQSRDLYEEHDIPWKRGLLFVGPAGNGKTHTLKAIINTIGYPCLYVKSFRAPHTGMADEANIRQVFDRARRNAPCVLVLEDLDSLITSQNRSFFLNELDGFAANIGIITLATTNHPERLDPAILERPSRFDRKYPFGLPELAERKAYIRLWNESLKPALRLTDDDIVTLSDMTDTFSFAYLKELFLSSKMRWIAKPQQGTMAQVMGEQVERLREQMISVNALPPNPDENEQDMNGSWFAANGGMVFRRMG